MKYPYQNKSIVRCLRWLGILSILSLALAACAPAATAVPTDVPTLASTDTPAVVASDTPAVTDTTAVTDTPAAATAPAMADTPAATMDATSATATSAASGGNATPMALTVNIAANATLGNILVDGAGMTLYKYANDTANTSTCSASCLANWPPLLAVSAVTAGTGLDGTQFGTTATTDGKMMVTYKGVPLYHFKNDVNPGDTNGNNVGGVWSVVAP